MDVRLKDNTMTEFLRKHRNFKNQQGSITSRGHSPDLCHKILNNTYDALMGHARTPKIKQ